MTAGACFLRANGTSPLRKDVRRELLSEKIDDAVVDAHHLQIDRDDFLKLAEQCYEALAGKPALAHDRMTCHD